MVAAIPHFAKQDQVELYAKNSSYQYAGAMQIFKKYGWKGDERVLDFIHKVTQ